MASGSTAEVGSTTAPRTSQCFSQPGTYGDLVVTTSGGGCGPDLTWFLFTGMWIGDGSVSEACTFSFDRPVAGASAMVLFAAHSCSTAGCEKVRFRLDNVDYEVQPADLDDNSPSGGDGPVSILAGGEVEGAGGDGDGRATVRFNGSPAAVTSIEIVHTWISGIPNGTVYQVCLDDTATSLIFADGFEDGSLAAWSTQVP